MKNFFQGLSNRFQLWMVGRYGYDELTAALYGVALAGLILSCFPKFRILYLPTLLIMGWALFRVCSKNKDKRQRERAAYLKATARVRGWFSVRQKAWQERKTHRYIRCKQCRTVLRVPKGKGKIQITCPQCHSQIVKKT
jgi:hypothetical protein